MQVFKIAFLVLLAASSALPNVIFSNFGSTPPGDIPVGGYESNRTRICFFPGACFFQTAEFAMGFSVPNGAMYELTDIQVPLAFPNGTTTSVDFTVLSDAGGKPGSPLETITIQGLTTSSLRYTADSVVHPVLSGGNYWLEESISTGDFGVVDWAYTNLQNDSGAVSGMTGPFGPGGWTNADLVVQAAFEMDGVAVPEPTSISLMGAIILGFSIFKRARKTF